MICILFGGWLSQRIPNGRIYVAIGMLVPTFIGLLLQIVLPRSNVAGLLTGVYLFPPFATSLFICLSLPGVNSSGYTKRITLSSYAFLGYALGNISGPFMIKVGETPAYRSVFVADMICIALQGESISMFMSSRVRCLPGYSQGILRSGESKERSTARRGGTAERSKRRVCRQDRQRVAGFPLRPLA